MHMVFLCFVLFWLPHISWRSRVMYLPVFYRLASHYSDVILGAMASEITSLSIVYSTIYSGADQRKHQSSASLAFVRGFTGTGEFPAQMASNAGNVSIWWRHHDRRCCNTPSVLEVNRKDMSIIHWYQTRTKHNKARILCIINGTYCMYKTSIPDLTHMICEDDVGIENTAK